MKMYKVFSTKILASGLQMAAKANGIYLEQQAFITTTPCVTKTIKEQMQHWSNGPQNAVFTSANGVAAVAPFFKAANSVAGSAWKVFCISGRTREALLQLFSPQQIVATAEYGSHLARHIIAAGVKEVIFFCGNIRREELPNMLTAAGIKVNELVVYQTKETPMAILPNWDAVLFFSPSAVQSFFQLNKLKESTVCFAIGTTTAASLAQHTPNKIVISRATTQEVLLQCVIDYFNQAENTA